MTNALNTINEADKEFILSLVPNAESAVVTESKICFVWDNAGGIHVLVKEPTKFISAGGKFLSFTDERIEFSNTTIVDLNEVDKKQIKAR